MKISGTFSERFFPGTAEGRRRNAGGVDEALPVAECEVVVAGTLGQFGHLFQQAGLPGAGVGLF